MPHSIISGDACVAYFNKLRDIPLRVPSPDVTVSNLVAAGQHAMRFFVRAIYVSIVFVSSLHASFPSDVNFQSYDNYDLTGTDLRSQQGVDLQACTAACRTDNQCRAYSFDKWTSRCSLKATLGALRFEPSSIAGLAAETALPPESTAPWSMQRFSGRSFSATSFRSEKLPSYDQCERTCENDQKCVALSYQGKQQTCSLFKSIGGYSTDHDTDSGIKRQVTSDEADHLRAAAERVRFVNNLTQAGNDLAALERFLTECIGDCPADLRSQVQTRVNEIKQQRVRTAELAQAARTDCDRLAGTPGDPELPAGFAGVQFTAIDVRSAEAACRRALEFLPDDSRLNFQLGRALHAAKDYAAALSFYRLAVAHDNAKAMNNLGTFYSNGLGVPKNDAEAARLYRRGANLGSPEAMTNLGLLYQTGAGTDKDEAEAERLFQRAAAFGYAVAILKLGVMYQEGKGVTKNSSEAARLFRKAAEQGNSEAMINLGVMYQKGDGVDKSETEATKLFRQAANLGSALGIFNLAVVYQNGAGVPKDDAKAVVLYRQAADLGNALAMTNLGVMYQKGIGLKKDEAEAVRLYRQAADLGERSGINNLGVMYQKGVGLAKNNDEAVRLYRKAVALGNADAMANLGSMYQRGVGVKKDEAEAVRLYRQGADLGSGVAAYNLGLMYANGLGVAKDNAEAIRLFRKAIVLGYSDAEKSLSFMIGHRRGRK